MLHNTPMQRLCKYCFLALSLVSTSTLAACTGARVHVRGTAEARPMLVEIAPGVWVVENYDRPVFYDDGYYWLYDDGYWFRSHTHTGSWARVQTHYVPRGVRGIERPRTYVHYRSRGQVRTRRAPQVDHRRSHRPAPEARSNERVPARRGTPPSTHQRRDDDGRGGESRDHRRPRP